MHPRTIQPGRLLTWLFLPSDSNAAPPPGCGTHFTHTYLLAAGQLPQVLVLEKLK